MRILFQIFYYIQVNEQIATVNTYLSIHDIYSVKYIIKVMQLKTVIIFLDIFKPLKSTRLIQTTSKNFVTEIDL